MKLPETRKPPGVTGGISEDDLLAGGIESDSIADLAAVADSSLRILVGLLMSCMPLAMARGLLEQLPPISDPVLAWWVTGIRLAVNRGITPNPLTASTAAVTGGFPAPPALRGLVVSAGWALAAESSSVPFICAPDLMDIIRAAEVRKAADKSIRVMYAALWTGELIDVATVVQRQAASILALLAEVIANG